MTNRDPIGLIQCSGLIEPLISPCFSIDSTQVPLWESCSMQSPTILTLPVKDLVVAKKQKSTSQTCRQKKKDTYIEPQQSKSVLIKERPNRTRNNFV